MELVQWACFLVATIAICVGGGWSLRTLAWPPEDGTPHLAAPRMQNAVMVALVGYTLFLVIRARAIGFLPISTVFEAVTFFLWCCICLTIWIIVRARMEALPTFLLPFLALLALLALGLARGPGEVRPELQTGLFLIHMLCAFLGYAAFTVGAFIASMYVLQEQRLRSKQLSGISRRLPSLEAMETLTRQLLMVGFPLFTVAIGLGVYLAHRHDLLDENWQRSAKVLSAAVTWVAYAVLFAGSRTAILYGRKIAWGTVAGFLGVLFTFLGTTLLLGTTHGNY